MNKIRVLRITGCSLCTSLIDGLRKSNIHFIELDADLNNDLSNRTEMLIGTINYPIVIVELPQATTYFFRANEASELGPTVLDTTSIKVGCYGIEAMIDQIKIILNK